MGLAGDSLTLQMPAGIFPVKASGRSWTLEAGYRSSREVEQPRAALAQMLGVNAQDIGERPLWADVGREQLIIPLTNEDAVRRAVIRPELLAQTSAAGAGMAYVFAQSGGRALARFFFSQGNTALEDPATGSATANFGAWWLAMGRPLPTSIEISQGEYTGRPSLLRLQVDAQRRIFVSGDVIEIGRGTIEL